MHAPATVIEHEREKPFTGRIFGKVWIFIRYIKYFSSFNPRAFWVGIVFSYIRAPLNAGTIFAGGLFIDSVVEYYNTPRNVIFAFFSIPYPIIIIFILCTLWMTQRALWLITNNAYINIRHKVWTGNREDIIRKFGNLNQQEIDAEDVKDEIEKILNFWYPRACSLYERIRDAGELLLNIIVAFYAVFTFNPLVAVIILLLPLPEIRSIFKNSKRFQKFVDDIAPLLLQRSYFFNILIDTRIFAEKKINTIHQFLEKRFLHIANGITKGYEHIQTRQEKIVTFWSLIDGFGMYFVQAVLVFQGLLEKTPVGRISYTLGYVDSLYTQLFSLENMFIQISDDLVFIEKQFEFVDRKSFTDALTGKRVLKKEVPALEFKNFTFTYPDTGITILKNANLIINPGDNILILGKDGSGKSSMVRFLAQLYEIQKGDILVDGTSLNSLRPGSIRDSFSVVAEDFGRYYMSLKDNIILGDHEKAFDKGLYEQVLKITGLFDWAKKVGLDDDNFTVGSFFDGGVEISSGHWQRIAIGRALYRNRGIFIFDQPFTYIDRASVNEIFPSIVDFIGNRTLIFIGEEVIFPNKFDAIYEMEDGQINKLSDKDVNSRWRRKSV